MKQWLCLTLVFLMLLAVGCSEAAQAEETAQAATEESVFSVPQELPGVWASASEGQLMLSETIAFSEDGQLIVTGTYQGSDAGTIYGTYNVDGDRIFCNITEGTTPFQVTYTFRIDGRELILTDSEGDARYLRTS